MESVALTATPEAESVVEQLAAGIEPSEYVAPLVTARTETTSPLVYATGTVKLPVAVLLRLFEAEQLTVVEPNGKSEPDAGWQVTVTLASTASVAVAV